MPIRRLWPQRQGADQQQQRQDHRLACLFPRLTIRPLTAAPIRGRPAKTRRTACIRRRRLPATLTANVVYAGLNIGTISGVAPHAYVMSYKVFYASQSGTSGFATAEGIAALEDVVADGADIVNNSWGSGPYALGGEADPLDQALINASAAGVFVVMSAGNAGPYASTADHPSPDYMTVAASTTGGNFVVRQPACTRRAASQKHRVCGVALWSRARAGHRHHPQLCDGRQHRPNQRDRV